MRSTVAACVCTLAVGLAFLAKVAWSLSRHHTGTSGCPCVDSLPSLWNRTVNSVDPSATKLGAGRDKEDCLLVQGVDKLRLPDEVYCYPTDYGRGHCETWDVVLPPECTEQRGHGHGAPEDIPENCKGWFRAREEPECAMLFDTPSTPLPWCREPWCYVDPDHCDLPHSPSYYFPGLGVAYSYATCGSANYFNIWNAVQLEMCQLFAVVEKPYPIMWLSCWACAFLQQLIDATRYFEENQDRLATGQRIYLLFQLFILVTETAANIKRIPWHENDFWSNYNLYVYVFINSSVFVRATMMSQVVWDWYDAKLLKYSVLPYQIDGKGWTDEMRAGILVAIFQFASSMGVFAVICITHLVPSLFVYHWIFLAVAAGVVKSRTWVALLGLDPESRSGRALVMGTNSFLSCMGIQILVTAMVRVYAGEWLGGYLTPLHNDFLARRLNRWYACHLSKGITLDIIWDQDFVNLFIR